MLYVSPSVVESLCHTRHLLFIGFIWVLCVEQSLFVACRACSVFCVLSQQLLVAVLRMFGVARIAVVY
jgi:hypothetical protein